MVPQFWEHAGRSNIVCVDSYDDGVLKGRFYSPYQEGESFSSLSQFLMKMESMLNDLQIPQSYTQLRSFADVHSASEELFPEHAVRQGTRATFELQILFRQHTSWQGMLRRRGDMAEYSFRSVLELVTLMDSALRCQEEYRYA